MVVKIKDNKDYLGIAFNSNKLEREMALSVPIFLVNGKPTLCIYEKLGVITQIGPDKFKWSKFPSRNFADYDATDLTGIEIDLRVAMQKLVESLPERVDRNKIALRLSKH